MCCLDEALHFLTGASTLKCLHGVGFYTKFFCLPLWKKYVGVVLLYSDCVRTVFVSQTELL